MFNTYACKAPQMLMGQFLQAGKAFGLLSPPQLKGIFSRVAGKAMTSPGRVFALLSRFGRKFTWPSDQRQDEEHLI